jgi:hypothetical protein
MNAYILQEWLTDMELSYTEGPMNLNWKQIMATVAVDDRFYMDTEEDEVTPKEAGWEFLRMYGNNDTDEEDDEEDDSEFDEEEENEGSAQSVSFNDNPDHFYIMLYFTYHPVFSTVLFSYRMKAVKILSLTPSHPKNLMTQTKILRSKAWIGMTWKRLLQLMIKESLVETRR